MSMETTEPDTGGGNDLRSRYLPVSRKELRRRREAELAALREAQESADATADELAGEDPVGHEVSEPGADEETAADGAEEELHRLVDDVESSESPQSADEVEPTDEPESAETTEEEPAEGETEDPAAEPDELQPEPETEDPQDQAEGATTESEPEDSESELVEPEAASVPETDAGHETKPEVAEEPEPTGDQDTLEESEDSQESDQDSDHAELQQDIDEGLDVAVADSPLPQFDQDEPERPEEEVADELAEAEEVDRSADLEDDSDAEVQEEQSSEIPAEAAGLIAETPEDVVDAEGQDKEEEAPIPASRRARRLLRDTASIPPLDEESIEQLNQITAEIARFDDPEKVDAELLKKQQALASRAMQANQERIRREQQQELRRRRQERPESEVITGRTVRNSLNVDDVDSSGYLTGNIEPVKASGAHGLDISQLVDETSREANRSNLMLVLVIVLAVLLVAAIAGVVYFSLT